MRRERPDRGSGAPRRHAAHETGAAPPGRRMWMSAGSSSLIRRRIDSGGASSRHRDARPAQGRGRRRRSGPIRRARSRCGPVTVRTAASISLARSGRSSGSASRCSSCRRLRCSEPHQANPRVSRRRRRDCFSTASTIEATHATRRSVRRLCSVRPDARSQFADACRPSAVPSARRTTSA